MQIVGVSSGGNQFCIDCLLYKEIVALHYIILPAHQHIFTILGYYQYINILDSHTGIHWAKKEMIAYLKPSWK